MPDEIKVTFKGYTRDGYVREERFEQGDTAVGSYEIKNDSDKFYKINLVYIRIPSGYKILPEDLKVMAHFNVVDPIEGIQVPEFDGFGNPIIPGPDIYYLVSQTPFILSPGETENFKIKFVSEEEASIGENWVKFEFHCNLIMVSPEESTKITPTKVPVVAD